ncbi:MAG TPA: cytochrome c1 [Chromatiales bacterium]|nr:cytochrome c1 [Chromatiales bacterium]
MSNIIETIFKLLAVFTIIFLVGFLIKAATGGAHENVPLQKADINIDNKASLQRGYKYATNYCLGCHAASYSRYNRVGRDLGISEKQLIDNLIFTSNERGEQSKVGDLMKVAMSKTYAKEAFGVVPPDLSLLTRSRGVDWIYTYLKSFYRDDSRPFGVNNLAFPDVGMPHVLWELQGWQKKVTHVEEDGHGHKHETVSLELSEPGTQTPAEYDQTVRDITNFMAYLAEPAQQKRKTLGFFVMLFLIVFFVAAYFLKKEYWKDIH